VSPDLRERISLGLETTKVVASRLQQLAEAARVSAPGDTETMACAALLHSFYTEIENIFKAIAQEIDGVVPRQAAWHRDLLRQMAAGTPLRGPVISTQLQDQLKPLMAFRHLFRGASILLMRWDRLSPLVQETPDIMRAVDAELMAFAELGDSR
jgi:hypothetical protein